MMINMKKAIARRTVLQGLGVTVALPLLDGMVPAFAAPNDTAAQAVRRLGAIYVPNGMAMPHWTPAEEGSAFELTPILQPLAPFRDRLLVLSGLSSQEAIPRGNEGGGDHSRAQATFLTDARPKKTEGGDVYVGVSVDQIVAKELGRQTQLASLEVGLESVELVGTCDIGYSCAYTATIAWRNPTTPLPMEIDPRAVFERLFGASGSTDSRARLARLHKDRSILDWVTHDVSRLTQVLGPGDRSRLTEYLDSVRDVERRIQMAETQSDRDLPTVERPAGIPATFEEHAKVMFDLLTLAYQCDLTRVFTFMMGRELSDRAYPEIGVPEPHHSVSHHGYDREKIANQAKIDTFHVQLLAYFLEKLQSTPDGDGSLLDHANILYGAGLSDGHVHKHVNQPILLTGGGTGQTRGGRHLRFADDTPLANLHLNLLDKMGISLERFGDSTGKLELLSAV